MPFKGPPRYNPKRRSVAFCSLGNNSFSVSNLGTLTRIPGSGCSSTNSDQILQNSGSITPSSPSCTSPLRTSSPVPTENGNCNSLLPSRSVSSAESYLAQQHQQQQQDAKTPIASPQLLIGNLNGMILGQQQQQQSQQTHPHNSVQRLQHPTNEHHYHHIQHIPLYQGAPR